MFESMEEAMQFLLTEVDENTKMRGNIKVQLAVDKIIQEAMEHGLSPDNLILILGIVLNRDIRVAQAMRSKLIKCLIPNSVVPEEAIIKTIFHISTKLLRSPGPSAVEGLLLRWILLVFDYLESHASLHKLYNIIFLFINSNKLMTFACHLLFLLTRKSDVRLFRVQQLMELMKKVGPDPALVGLLTCYKVFKPHLVPIRLESSHKLFFKTHDSLWRDNIVGVVSKNTERSLDSAVGMDRPSMPTYMPKCKRQKLVVPEVHSAAKEVEEIGDIPDLPEACGSIPYQHVESFLHFMESIDKIEYPSQIGACLQDSRLMLLMSCNPDQVAITRLCLWLQHFLVFGFKGKGVDDSGRSETLLKMLLKFSQTVQTLPVVHGFLESFLPYWNGQTHAPLILELVSCITPCSFQDLQMSILNPLSHLFFASDVYFKSMYVASMSKLIKNFAFHLYSLQSTRDQNETNSTRNKENEETNTNFTEIMIYTDCLHQLMDYLDVQLVIGMRMEEDHLLLQQTVLDMLNMVASNDPNFQVPMANFPTRIIQRLLLSDYSVTIARLCGIVNLFRRRFALLQHVQKTSAKDLPLRDTQSQTFLNAVLLESSLLSLSTSKFNALLIDMLGMLWHGNLTCERKKQEYHSIFQFPLPPKLEGKVQGNSLSMYNNPAFLGLAYKFLTETQREEKKLHPSMIQKFRDIYLQFLDRENFPQVKELVNLNLKSRKSKSQTDTTSVANPRVRLTPQVQLKE